MLDTQPRCVYMLIGEKLFRYNGNTLEWWAIFHGHLMRIIVVTLNCAALVQVHSS